MQRMVIVPSLGHIQRVAKATRARDGGFQELRSPRPLSAKAKPDFALTDLGTYSLTTIPMSNDSVTEFWLQDRD